MKSMDDFQELDVSSLAHEINEYVQNREFGYAHEMIHGSREQWKEKVHYELLCDEAQIMAELILCGTIFSSCSTK